MVGTNLYDFSEDFVPIEPDCNKIEVRVIEVDYIDFVYRENGFCYPDEQYENLSLEIGEYSQIKPTKISSGLSFIWFVLIALTLISLVILIYILGGLY